MSNPITRLHNDLHRLNVAKQHRSHDAHELKKDTKDGKAAHRHLDHHRDTFKATSKELTTDRAALGKLKDAEKAALDPLQAQRDQLQAAYDASVDPLTGQGDPAIQMQLGAVDQQIADTKAKFDPKIAAKKSEVDGDVKKKDDTRKAIHADIHDIHKLRNEIKHDKKALAHDKKAVHNARHTALKDLKPAEYKMGLKQTNRVRQELGLKKVHHVIRPDQVNLHALPPQYRSYAKDIVHSAKKYHLPAAFIAAVISRETNGQNIIGDFGHGHGLMQIDDRFHGSWLASHHNGLDPKSNIDYGCSILRANLNVAHSLGLHGASALKFAASAYNAGVGGAENGLHNGNSDMFTTGGNYGSDVLHRMGGFKRAFQNS